MYAYTPASIHSGYPLRTPIGDIDIGCSFFTSGSNSLRIPLRIPIIYNLYNVIAFLFTPGSTHSARMPLRAPIIGCSFL